MFDTAVGAQATTEVLEYANSQLLEFRHYDELLSRELEGVYRMLEKGTGALARWRLAHEATRLHTVLLEVTELTERTENAIKFLGDMFSARLHRMVAMKIGVPDYKNLVSQKLRTAEELYHFMVDQFHQGHAFILEAVVVVILVIELAYYFYGHISYHRYARGCTKSEENSHDNEQRRIRHQSQLTGRGARTTGRARKWQRERTTRTAGGHFT